MSFTGFVFLCKCRGSSDFLCSGEQILLWKVCERQTNLFLQVLEDRENLLVFVSSSNKL